MLGMWWVWISRDAGRCLRTPGDSVHLSCFTSFLGRLKSEVWESLGPSVAVLEVFRDPAVREVAWVPTVKASIPALHLSPVPYKGLAGSLTRVPLLGVTPRLPSVGWGVQDVTEGHRASVWVCMMGRYPDGGLTGGNGRSWGGSLRDFLVGLCGSLHNFSCSPGP